MDTRVHTTDDPEYVREQLLRRFKHLDLGDPFTRTLFEEALRRHLGQKGESR